MTAVTRIGDLSTGHGSFIPTPSIESSPDVYANSKGVMRVGDAYEPHPSSSSPPHTQLAAAGSSTVFVNGIPVHRIGDSIECGGSAAQGSPDVFAGG